MHVKKKDVFEKILKNKWCSSHLKSDEFVCDSKYKRTTEHRLHIKLLNTVIRKNISAWSR